MADKTVRGRFVWHELLTPDTARAQSFYTKVLGWRSQPWDEDPSYTMFVAAGGPLGGSVQSSEQPRWLPYVRTDDIEATVEKARELGANVSKEITDMRNGGRYAVLTDPQGAELGVYWSTSEPGPESVPKRGEYSWYELATSDYRAAFDFYSQLFDWEPTGEHDMGGELGVYFMFGRNGVPLGGIFNRPADMPAGPGWLGYVRVKDVQQTVKKVSAAGGTLVLGPMEVPGGDWVAQFLDPQGAVFAVHTLAADVKNAAAAAARADAEPEGVAATAAPAAEPQPRKAAASSKSAAKKSRPSARTAAAKRAKKAAKKSAKKSGQKAKKTGKKAASQKAATKKAAKKAAKKAGKKKVSKKRTAARGAKRPARKVAKAKKSTKKRSAGKKKAAKRARKGK